MKGGETCRVLLCDLDSLAEEPPFRTISFESVIAVAFTAIRWLWESSRKFPLRVLSPASFSSWERTTHYSMDCFLRLTLGLLERGWIIFVLLRAIEAEDDTAPPLVGLLAITEVLDGFSSLVFVLAKLRPPIAPYEFLPLFFSVILHSDVLTYFTASTVWLFLLFRMSEIAARPLIPTGTPPVLFKEPSLCFLLNGCFDFYCWARSRAGVGLGTLKFISVIARLYCSFSV